jgi:hypothetical protein
MRGTLVVATLLAAAAPAAAQDASDRAAYRALTQTPLAALAPLLDVSVLSAGDRGPTLHSRYGLMSYDDREYIHNFGVGADFPVGSGRVGVTAGFYWPNCDNDRCSGHVMASGHFSSSLFGTRLGRSPRAARLNLGVDAGGGVGAPRGETLLAAAATVTAAVVPYGESVRLVPFIAPGVGVGLVRNDEGTEAGIRPTFGAGLGLLGLGGGLGVNAGISRVALRRGNWLAGVGLTWNAARAGRGAGRSEGVRNPAPAAPLPAPDTPGSASASSRRAGR